MTASGATPSVDGLEETTAELYAPDDVTQGNATQRVMRFTAADEASALTARAVEILAD